MGKLSGLRITGSVPQCWASFATKHNELIDLLENMQGGPGVKVDWAYSPKKAPIKIPGGSSSGAAPSHGSLGRQAPHIVNGIHQAQPPRPPRPPVPPRGRGIISVSPTALQGIGAGGTSNGSVQELHYNANSVTVDIDGAGIIQTSPTGESQLQANAFFVSGPNASMAFTSTGLFELSNFTKSVSIPQANITQDITIRTFVGCNSGNAANYLVIASDFF